MENTTEVTTYILKYFITLLTRLSHSTENFRRNKMNLNEQTGRLETDGAGKRKNKNSYCHRNVQNEG